MKIEEYLKDSFADIANLEPIDISQAVLARLPKYNLGIFTDPLMRNIALSLIAVLIIASSRLGLNPGPSYQDSRLIAIEGEVKVYKKGTWQKPAPHSYLARGSVLKTDKQSLLKLELPDKSNLLLQENSLLELRRAFPRVEFNLIKGGLLIFAEKSGSRKSFSILAGHLEIRALGTVFKVFVDADTIQVEVLEGRVEVRDYLENKELISLKKLEQATIKMKGEPLLSVRELLAEETNSLTAEFGFPEGSKVTPQRIRRILWWREAGSDE